MEENYVRPSKKDLFVVSNEIKKVLNNLNKKIRSNTNYDEELANLLGYYGILIFALGELSACNGIKQNHSNSAKKAKKSTTLPNRDSKGRFVKNTNSTTTTVNEVTLPYFPNNLY